MIGMGNAPIFPNMLHLTPQNFGEDISQSVIGIEMAASYTGIMLAPAFFGLIAQNISIVLFSYYLLILFIIMIRATWMLKQKLKIAGTSIHQGKIEKEACYRKKDRVYYYKRVTKEEEND